MDFLEHFVGVTDVVGAVFTEIRKQNTPLVLFGAGYCSSMVLDLCEMECIPVEAIIDNAPEKQGGMIRGTPIVPFDDLLLHFADDGFQILFSTSHYEEIEVQLREKKHFLGKTHHFPKTVYYKNCALDLAYLEQERARFEEVYDLFEDEISRRVMLGVLKHDISGDDRYYDELIDIETNGYFGTSLYTNREDEVIVDAGAFDGDTIREFQSVPSRSYKHIYAYEPDEENYHLLFEYSYGNPKITPICAGLGEQATFARFWDNASVSSRIDDDGNRYILIETLDDRSIPATFIKMDIEGAEYR